MRRLDLAPRTLRAQGLVDRIHARDEGDVIPPAYVDFERPEGKPRNEEGVADYSRALGARVAAAGRDGSFVLVLGGDCSIVLGSLLGAGKAVGPRIGLVYIDAQADFASPIESRTGSAAGMCLALAVGRGGTPLARLREDGPLVHGEHTALLARRDQDEPGYGQNALDAFGILDLPHEEIRSTGPEVAARAALERVTRPGVAGFWVHVDVDVLDPSVMPAVDSPTPDGIGLDELAALLAPLVRDPAALGMELSIYDPWLDPDRACAERIATLLDRVLVGGDSP